MDHIKTQIVSSEPVSLSLVSSIFERFLSSDNGINREVYACLKRSAATIDNLIQAKTLKFKQGMGQKRGTPHETLDKEQPLEGHDRKEQSACGDVGMNDLEKGHQSKQKKQTKKLESLDEARWLNALERDSSEEHKKGVVENSEREHGKKNKKHHRLHHSLDQDVPRNEVKLELRQHPRKGLRRRHKQQQHVQESVQTEDTRWEMVEEDIRKKKRRKMEARRV
ncbi:uncharacterized protein LOC116263546 [Nymphaea colorata]|uniref:uncharacterized protein LOC116263546 n=1 Tax=Nymphaea colorata TaxID=210225 RepID=UPI00129E3F0C|nr:uncharacterized protein LOC116263546 [Nymphaea colorata]